MANKENFKISAALKNLIGKELITDENVAVFELVKNSFDAYATKVEIIFENLNTNSGNTKLIIKDNGKGMNYDDLKNKWLFVAYSAKVDGTEDRNYHNGKDYRDKIQEIRTYAGAKGIGRFSCDRLGKKLNLISIKDEPKAKIETLSVHWENFEKDPTDQFINVTVNHNALDSSIYKNFKKGTILEIEELRDTWNRERLLKLKRSLEKLINPNQENDVRNFTIELIAKEERQNDSEVELERDKVNGPIKNFLFEALDLKTTQILTEIVDAGENIKTVLTDRGRVIYSIIEKNRYIIKSNISIHLFQLNQAAKLNFRKIMGIPPREYGSVFLYKNGFRVYPFGDWTEDILGIDNRKAQGYARFLGQRDLIGRIEINDKKNIDVLKETTSRDGGLIKNEYYDDLVYFFFEKALKRLENYVVNLIRWGDPLAELEGKAVDPNDIKEEIIYLISNIAKDEDILKLDYDKEFLNIINERSNENLPKNLKNFEKLAEKTDNPTLQKKARKIISQFKEHQRALEEFQGIEEKKEKAEKELKIEKRKNQFLLTAAKDTTPEVLGLVHHIEMQTNDIYEKIDMAIKKLNKGSFDFSNTLKLLTEIKLHSDKILKISRLVTHSNFSTINDEQKGDMVSYIAEYCEYYKNLANELNIPEKNLNIEINGSDLVFELRFSAVDLGIVLDNLFSNAQKHKARKCMVNFKVNKSELLVTFSDDGLGIKEEVSTYIFDLGFTTTKGSGIGLYYVKELMKKNGGDIKFVGNDKTLKGAIFEMRFYK